MKLCILHTHQNKYSLVQTGFQVSSATHCKKPKKNQTRSLSDTLEVFIYNNNTLGRLWRSDWTRVGNCMPAGRVAISIAQVGNCTPSGRVAISIAQVGNCTPSGRVAISIAQVGNCMPSGRVARPGGHRDSRAASWHPGERTQPLTSMCPPRCANWT